MGLEKLTITTEKDNKGFTVLFNPNEITMTIPGGKVHDYGFVNSRDPITLNVDLFFDTTFKNSESVNKYTDKIVQLTQDTVGSESLGRRPALCELKWGKKMGDGGTILRNCFLEQLTKRLTHFLKDGTPTRAILSCTFRQWLDPNKIEQEKINDPVRIVKKGETLSSIATEELGDPALWRMIADENLLINPRQLLPGTLLHITPL